ncbi:hypothetical protein ACFL6I_05585 [candidate division KSB1 bacterium]
MGEDTMTTRHVLLVISDKPFDQETVDDFKNKNCRHCVQVSVSTESQPVGGGIIATVMETSERLGLGKNPKLNGVGLSESPAIANLLERMLEHGRYQPEWWRYGKHTQSLLHTP